MKCFKLFVGILASLILNSCVSTLTGPAVGSFRYGGYSITFADDAQIPLRKSEGNSFVQLTVNGVTGWYRFDPEDDFTMVDRDNPIMKDAVDPKTGGPLVQKLSFDLAGIKVWDAGFFKADNYLVTVYDAEEQGSPVLPGETIAGSIGRDVFMGFLITEDGDRLILNKGYKSAQKPKLKLGFNIFLPLLKKDLDAKILAYHFSTHGFTSPESYFPPTMFVSYAGLNILSTTPLNLFSGNSVTKFSMVMEDYRQLKYPQVVPVKISLDKLLSGEDIYTVAVREGIKVSGLSQGWVRLKYVDLIEDQLLFLVAVAKEHY